MQFTATLRYARMSPRKMKYTVELIRGKTVNEALAILGITAKRGARFLNKLVKSAIANADHLSALRNTPVDTNALRIVEAAIGPGPTMKRWRTAPMGRGLPIKKRTCHVKLVLSD